MQSEAISDRSGSTRTAAPVADLAGGSPYEMAKAVELLI